MAANRGIANGIDDFTRRLDLALDLPQTINEYLSVDKSICPQNNKLKIGPLREPSSSVAQLGRRRCKVHKQACELLGLVADSERNILRTLGELLIHEQPVAQCVLRPVARE